MGRRIALGLAMFCGFSWLALMVAAAIYPPRKSEAAEYQWVDLPGQHPASMVRFYDKQAGVLCYLIPGKYDGGGRVFSPALSCMPYEPVHEN